VLFWATFNFCACYFFSTNFTLA